MKKERIFHIFKAKDQNSNTCLLKTNSKQNKNDKKQQIFKLTKKIRNQKISKWTVDEDLILLDCEKKPKRNKWKICASKLKNKTPYQCYLRYKKINPNIKKGRWTEIEDKQVIELVNMFGKSWKSIAKIIKNRSNKQIRNRYEEHLCETLNKGLFTKEEDEKLIHLYKKYEKNWCEYKKNFKDRSIKRIKGRIVFLIKRRKIKEINLQNKIKHNECKVGDKLDNFLTSESSVETILSKEDCDSYYIKKNVVQFQSNYFYFSLAVFLYFKILIIFLIL